LSQDIIKRDAVKFAFYGVSQHLFSQYWTPLWNRVPLTIWKLLTYPYTLTVYGTWRFIPHAHKNPPMVLILSQM